MRRELIQGGLKIFLIVGHIAVEIFLQLNYVFLQRHTFIQWCVFQGTGKVSLIND